MRASTARHRRNQGVGHALQPHPFTRCRSKFAVSGAGHCEVFLLGSAPFGNENVGDRGTAGHDIVRSAAISALNISPGTWLDDGDITAVIGQHPGDRDFRFKDAIFGSRSANAKVLDQSRIDAHTGRRLFTGAFRHQLHVHEW